MKRKQDRFEIRNNKKKTRRKMGRYENDMSYGKPKDRP